MDIFKKYNNKIDYNVRIINLNKQIKAMSFNFANVSHQDITKKDRYLASNRNREIMFRPNDKRFILADFDNNPSQTTLNNVKKMGAFLIICSSKNHYQAWFFAPNVKTWEDYTNYAKYICYKFGSDMGSTKKGQIGRLPPYINRKPGRNNYKVKVLWQISDLIKPANLPKLKIDKRELMNVISSNSSVISKDKNNNKDNNKDNNKKRKQGSEPSNPMPKNESNDWAFLCHLRDHEPRFPTMTRDILIQLLFNIQRDGFLVDIEYLSRTVDNFLRLYRF